MNTAIQSNPLSFSTENERVMTYSSIWDSLEKNRFGAISLILTVVACTAGFAAAFAVKESVVQLAIISISAAIVEAFILAVLPMKAITITAAVSVFINLSIIVLNILF